MSKRARAWLGLGVLLALAALPRATRAQVYLGEVPEWELSGSALVSYLGSWQDEGGHLIPAQQLSEGVSLSLSGWLYQSRLIRFRVYAMVLRLDDFGASRGKGYSVGYGGSLRLLSGSILPLTFAYGQGLAVTGSTLQAAGVTSTTSLQGFAQLVSPVLPRIDVRVQHLTADDVTGTRTVDDVVSASAYGSSVLHRYSALASWEGQQVSAQPRTTTTLASVSDDAYPSKDTLASFRGTLTRSTGLGGTAGDVFTSYSASGTLTSLLSPGALVRGQYSFSEDTAPDREQTSNQAALGGTFTLHSLPLMLGEGLAASETRYVAPGLDRIVNTVSASQGVAAHGRWGTTSGTLAATGQGGYSSVSDGGSGPAYGYGLNATGQWFVPRAPIHASAFYNDRVDHSAADASQLTYGALVSSDVALWYPLYLIPIVSYTHVEQRSFFAELPGGTGLAAPLTFTNNDVFTAAVTGTAPLYQTRLSFAGGYTDSTSPSSSSVRQIFARAADAFRVAPGTFGNLSIDTSHLLGQTTTVTALGSLVWSFRESTLSATYTYDLTVPTGSAVHTVALLFTRNFDAAFLRETH